MFTIPKNARPDANCYQLLVTPELANEWLSHNPLNRPLNEKKAANIARLMQAGLWKHVWQPVILGQNIVLDGQHRLKAIVLSGLSMIMSVVFNQDENDFMFLDCGSIRTKLDMVRLGLQDHTIKGKHLAVLRAMLAGTNCGGLRQLTSVEMKELYRKHRKAVDFAIALLGKEMDSTVLGILARAFYSLPKETIQSLAAAWKDGSYQPLVEFRQYLAQLEDRQIATRQEIYKRFEFAIEAFLNNRDAVSSPLYWDEMFPLP